MVGAEVVRLDAGATRARDHVDGAAVDASAVLSRGDGLRCGPTFFSPRGNNKGSLRGEPFIHAAIAFAIASGTGS
jgi:hypothetical protein